MTHNPTRSSRRTPRLAGWVLLALGVLLNEWVAECLFIPDGRIDSAGLRVLLWAGCLTGILAGLYLLFRPALPPAGRPVKRPPGQRVLVAAVATLLAVGLAEGTLRLLGFQPWQPDPYTRRVTVEPEASPYVLDRETGYANRPGRFVVHLGTGHTFRARHLDDGTRAVRPPGTPVPAGRPLWIFGCSFTYGWALDDDETFAWRLQERLPAFDVVNYGVPGYGDVQALLRFRQALRRSGRPALVVLAYASFHDARNTFSRIKRKQMALDAPRDSLSIPYARLGPEGRLVYAQAPVSYRALPLARRSALINLADDAYNALEQRALGSRAVTRALIRAFAEEAREQGALLLVAGLTADPATASLLAYCRQQGIPAVDIAVDLAGPGSTNLPYDPHPSAVANRVYAERLAAYIVRAGLTPPL